MNTLILLAPNIARAYWRENSGRKHITSAQELVDDISAYMAQHGLGVSRIPRVHIAEAVLDLAGESA